MAFISIRQPVSDIWLGLWKIEESVEEFINHYSYLAKYQTVLKHQYHSDSRRREFLAVRALLHEMLGAEKGSLEIEYLQSGKPVLDGYQISISHTKGFAAVILSKEHNVAIDIEYSSARVERIVSKFMRVDEIANNTLQQLIHWSAKETIYKLYSEDDLHFEEMRVKILNEYTLDSCVVENMKRKQTINVFCEITPEYVLTYASL